jgi:hypothetical protein
MEVDEKTSPTYNFWLNSYLCSPEHLKNGKQWAMNLEM